MTLGFGGGLKIKQRIRRPFSGGGSNIPLITCPSDTILYVWIAGTTADASGNGQVTNFRIQMLNDQTAGYVNSMDMGITAGFGNSFVDYSSISTSDAYKNGRYLNNLAPWVQLLPDDRIINDFFATSGTTSLIYYIAEV